MGKSNFISKYKLNNSVYCFLLCVSCVLLTIPLFDDKLIPGHDYIFHVTRILDVAEALKQGIFPVRIYVDTIQFWGTPVGIFYPSLFNYIPAFLKLSGFPVEICYNAFIILIIIIGAFVSWYGFSLLTKSKQAGFFSAILYISSGYYLLDAYIRNALGELLGLSFLPLAIACCFNVIAKPKLRHKNFIMAILAASAVIESHVLSSLFLFLSCLCYMVFLHRIVTIKRLYRIATVALIIFTLNSSFIIPFLFFYKHVPVTLDFTELFISEGLTSFELLRFVIVGNFWLLNILYLLFFIKKQNINYLPIIKQKQNVFYKRCVLFGLLFLFMSSDAFPWNYLSILKSFFETMQFPWRFLGVSTLFFCFCGGLVLRVLSLRFRVKTVYIILLTIIVCTFNLIVVYNIGVLPGWTAKNKIYWERLLSTTDDDYLYNDMNVGAVFEQKDRYYSKAKITNWRKQLTDISFSYQAAENTSITLPLVNYPGYLVRDSKGNIIEITDNKNHMMVVFLKKGTDNIRIHYEGITLFKVADMISFFSLLIFVCYVIQTVKQKRWDKIIL